MNAAIAAARERAATQRAEVEALARSCLRQPAPGCLFDAALATARGIEDASSRAWVLGRIGAAQADAATRAFEDALATARGIEDASGRAQALREIAEAQAEAGQPDSATRAFEDALATARGIGGASSRALVLREIAEAQAEAGQLDAALATARAISDAALPLDVLALAYVGIAAALSRGEAVGEE